MAAILFLPILVNFCVGADVFYNIAHGVNTIRAVDWAITEGANAVELDLDFTRSGQINKFSHGSPCDCTCICPFPFTRLCLRTPEFSCYPLRLDFTNPCNTEAAVEDVLPYVASRPEIALVYIDSKLEDGDDTDVAGSRIIQAIEQLLFGQGYAGDVIVGAYSFSQTDYLAGVLSAKSNSPFGRRISFVLEDGIKTPFIEAMGIVKTFLAAPTVLYGHGKSSCIPLSLSQTDLQLAAINKANGFLSMAYTWTVDRTPCIENQLDYVNGIITNYPSRVLEVIQRTGRRLATTADRLPTIRTEELILDPSPYDCECDFYQTGCVIRIQAPAGLACKCERVESSRDPQECTGKFVMCRDSSSAKCTVPDLSLESCQLGGGDCDGYDHIVP